ncbi:MAG: D-2-hydroxyacid dehydrogenase, partial [Prevotella sp.]|nr:D-2-hydroxyacid dehydrogenase [Prevotella sp.]
NRLLAYCTDVMGNEPPSINNPLLQCPNAYITPHIAWATREARIRLLDIVIDNVKAFVSGKPVNVV